MNSEIEYMKELVQEFKESFVWAPVKHGDIIIGDFKWTEYGFLYTDEDGIEWFESEFDDNVWRELTKELVAFMYRVLQLMEEVKENDK